MYQVQAYYNKARALKWGWGNHGTWVRHATVESESDAREWKRNLKESFTRVRIVKVDGLSQWGILVK
jgi:hypothetical protein